MALFFLVPIVFISRNIYLYEIEANNVTDIVNKVGIYLFIFSCLVLSFVAIWKFILPFICRLCKNRNINTFDANKSISRFFPIVSNIIGININEDKNTAFKIFQQLCFIPASFLFISFWANNPLVYLAVGLFYAAWFYLTTYINFYYDNKASN